MQPKLQKYWQQWGDGKKLVRERQEIGTIVPGQRERNASITLITAFGNFGLHLLDINVQESGIQKSPKNSRNLNVP